MRIALSFSGCHRRGGVERVLLECANFLHARGHETHVYASDWDAASLRPGILRHHLSVRMRPSVLHLPMFARQSRRAIAEMNPAPDVLGSFGAHSPPGGVMWVQSVHRAWLQISQTQRAFSGRLKQRCNLFHPMILAYEKCYFGGRRYRKLIALTQQVKLDLMQWYNVPADDIVIIPNGFSASEFNVKIKKDCREPMRQQLGYDIDDKVVIFVANELQRKGFEPLLQAMASLHDPRLHLLVVGRVSSDACQEQIKKLGMAQRVQFVGSSSNVADYYAAADVFALPTQYEAWGLVIVEAMACGLPVLTSRLAGASIAVHEGQTGHLLDNPRDTAEIARKLSPLLAGQHASPEEISASVARFAWSEVLLDYENVLAQCAK